MTSKHKDLHFVHKKQRVPAPRILDWLAKNGNDLHDDSIVLEFSVTRA